MSTARCGRNDYDAGRAEILSVGNSQGPSSPPRPTRGKIDRMPAGTCKFCGTTAELRKSHIIPEFVYRPLYDSKHRAITLPADSPTGYLQKGYRAPLLCEACEQFFNEQFEKPFKAIFFDKPLLPKVAFRKKYTINVGSYRAVKLFLLSVLWRAGVCEQVPFEKVHLGPHEADIRVMLEQQTPGDAENYPIFAYLGLLPDSREVGPFVIQPYSPGEIDGHRVYVFVFGGCMWHFVLSKASIPKLLVHNVLQSDGRIVIPTVDVWNVPALNKYFVRHFQAAQERGEI